MMYSSTLSSMIAAGSFFILASASPVEQSQSPYFAVRGFSFSKSDTSSRYEFNMRFPQYVVTSPASGADPTYTIPGFVDPVPCTGTYFHSPNENSTVTTINACGTIGNGKTQTVTSKLDVDSGDLYLTYTYNATSDGAQEVFVYHGTQNGLTPVDPDTAEGFNAPATGPGTS